MRTNKDVMLRTIAGEHLLIPVGEMAMKLQGMIAMSESGGLLWKRLEQGAETEDLVRLLLEEYEVTEEVAREDVEAFLTQMRTLEILEEN